jgi:hypothetical protein
MSRRRQLHLGNAITIVVAGRPRRANVKTWLPPVGLFRWQGHSGTYGEFNLRDRRRLGIADARPLPHTVCNFIYRLDAEGGVLASDILKQWHSVAARDWSARYGWMPEHWETLVDPAEVASTGSTNPGACFRRAGYRSLGLTTGRSARRPPGATHGARVWSDATKKLVLYRGPLDRKAA